MWPCPHCCGAASLIDCLKQFASVTISGCSAARCNLAELADVLSRPSPTKQLALIGRSVLEVLTDYLEIVEVVEPDDVPRVVPGDADDDHVIAAAVTAQATLIVSGDSDLLSMGSYRGIDIWSAAIAVEQIGRENIP